MSVAALPPGPRAGLRSLLPIAIGRDPLGFLTGLARTYGDTLWTPRTRRKYFFGRFARVYPVYLLSLLVVLLLHSLHLQQLISQLQILYLSDVDGILQVDISFG